MNDTRRLLAMATMGLLLLSVESNAAVFQVADSAGLQSALDSARTNGEDDEIRLTYGTYAASGPFAYGTASNDNHTVLLSGGWAPNVPGLQIDAPDLTKLDGGGQNPVLQIKADAAGVNITFKIANLTIQNGYARSGDVSGAGIESYSGTAGQGSIQLEVRNCIFQNNVAANNKAGGAIYSTGALEVHDSRFLSNSAYNGGALFVTFDPDASQSAAPIVSNSHFEDNFNYGNQGSTIWHNVALQVRNCTFKGRSDGVSSSGNGSAIWGNNGSHLNIANSVFSDISIKYWGAAIQAWYSDMDVTNCLFANNHSGVGAGGNGYGAIALLSTPDHPVNITNSTFTGNTDSSSYSGAIHNRGGTVNLNNCIFWDNGGDTGVYNESGSTTMRYCLHGGGSMYGVTDDGTSFFANPLFISDDVFRLGPDSPCIDAGSNDLVPADAVDVDDDGDRAEPTPLDVQGKARFRDDPYTPDAGAGTAPIVDIGAYEYQQTARFGAVDGKKNVTLTLKDTSNNDVVFALSGSGFGVVDPSDPTFELIEIYNMNDDAEKAAFAISTKAKAGSSAGSVLVYAPIKSIKASNIDLKGKMKIGAAAMGSKAAATIAFDEADGLDVESDMPIKSITAFGWYGSLTSPSVGKIVIKGDEKSGKWGGLDIDVNADVVGTVKVAGELGGSWDCRSVKSVAALETDDFYLTLSQPPDPKLLALGKLTVKQAFAWSRIDAAGNIGAVSVGEMRHSSCFAGVAGASDVEGLNGMADGVLDLPAAGPSTFAEAATIKSVAIKGIKGESENLVVNSNIAAENILGIALLHPEYGNGGVAFGVAAGYIKALKVKDASGSLAFKNLDTAADAPPLTGDMVIRLY